jgi:hypothetical protein
VTFSFLSHSSSGIPDIRRAHAHPRPALGRESLLIGRAWALYKSRISQSALSERGSERYDNPGFPGPNRGSPIFLSLPVYDIMVQAGSVSILVEHVHSWDRAYWRRDTGAPGAWALQHDRGIGDDCFAPNEIPMPAQWHSGTVAQLHRAPFAGSLCSTLRCECKLAAGSSQGCGPAFEASSSRRIGDRQAGALGQT